MNKIINQKNVLSAVILALFTVGVFASPVSSVEAATKKIKVQCRSTHMWHQRDTDGDGLPIMTSLTIGCEGFDKPRDWKGATGIKNGEWHTYKGSKKVDIEYRDSRSAWVTIK